MKLQNVSIVGFRSIEFLTDLRVGSPLVLAGHNDAGKSTIIDAVLFLLGSYDLTESDRTYIDLAPVADDDEPQAPGRVSETFVEGVFALNGDEVATHGVATLRLRRISADGDASKLEMLTMAPVDARLRDYGTLTIPFLKDRLDTLGLAQTGNKAELIERLDAAAAAAQKEELWVTASTAIDRALPTVKRFDASSAVDAEAAIQSTLQTKFKAHL